MNADTFQPAIGLDVNCLGTCVRVQFHSIVGAGIEFGYLKVTGGNEHAYLYKCHTGDGIHWLGLCDISEADAIGIAAETNAKMYIPALQPVFGSPLGTVQINAFFIDGIKVEKAVFPFTQPGLIHYKLFIEDGWAPVIGCFQLSQDSFCWHPVSVLSPQDFLNMTEMLEEYEDGTYQYYSDLNNALSVMLRRLESNSSPSSD